MTGEVCHGGRSEYTKWSRARQRVKVKLKREFVTEVKSTAGPVDVRIIPRWELLRE